MFHWMMFLEVKQHMVCYCAQEVNRQFDRPKKRGASYLKLIGKGTDLASIEMPQQWCEKTQLWLMEQLGI